MILYAKMWIIMPELPEVEALRRGLVQRIVGSKILKVEVRQEKIIAGKGTTRKADKKKTSEFINELVGKKILGIDRRAKNLIFNLSSLTKGGPRGVILVHLKMTGQLVFTPSDASHHLPNGKDASLWETPRSGEGVVLGGHPIFDTEKTLPHKHTHIIFTLNNGTLYYNDVRQFGYVLYYNDKNIIEEENHFKDVGIEPFDKNFTFEYFREHLKNKTTPIKKLLLDQTVVVGCGNIYCDEVLWASSVLPQRPANKIKESEAKDIYENIKKILNKAIESGGSSVANYLLADGKRGNYADFHMAYKKEGAKCKFVKDGKACTGIIKKITFAGRGTHFCPVHQH
jgi:formamidopyrimidine-DNA glycosylase